MINKIKNYINKEKSKDLNQWKEDFFHRIVTNPSHIWISEDPRLTRVFKILIDSFDEKTQKLLKGKENIMFYPSEGILGSAFSSGIDHNIIILYPDLVKMLKSGAFTTAVSILAHEIGHIAFDHSKRKIDKLEAQIEADYFAYLLGFGEELQNFLMDYDNSIDNKVRVSKLTSLIVSSI